MAYDRAAAMRANNANPEYRKKRLAGIAKVNSDPEWQAKRIKGVKAYFAKPEVKMKRGELQKRRWLDDAYYEKTVAKIKKALAKKAVKQRQIEGINKGAKERANRPTAKERSRQQMIALNKKRNPLFGMTQAQKEKYKRLRKCGEDKNEAIRRARAMR